MRYFQSIIFHHDRASSKQHSVNKFFSILFSYPNFTGLLNMSAIRCLRWIFVILRFAFIYSNTAYNGKPRVTIRAGGATLPLDIYKVWTPLYEAFRTSSVDVDYIYSGTGSVQGVTNFLEGRYDFAGSDAELTEITYLQNPDLQMFPVLAGPVSIAYNIPDISRNCTDPLLSINSDLNCLRLSREVLVQIFNGKISFWNDPELVLLNPTLKSIQERITVVVRADGSGTTSIFTSALQSFWYQWNGGRITQFSDGCDGHGRPVYWNPNLKIFCSKQGRGTSNSVLNTPYSISYMGPGDARDATLPEAILQNRAGEWVAPSIESAQAAMDASASGSRLTASLVDRPGNKSYPIAGYTYFVIHLTTMTNCTLATELLRMFEFVLQDALAQSIVRDLGRAPISPAVFRQVKKFVFDRMECNGRKVADLLGLERGPDAEAWKVPVAIVVALVLVILGFAGTFVAYLKYQQYRHVFRNTFLVTLIRSDTPGNAKGGVVAMGVRRLSTTSVASAMSRSGASLAIIGPWVEDMHDSGEVIKLANGSVVWVREMCHHFQPNSLPWPTRVQLVRLKERISHQNVLKMLGVAQDDETTWKLVTDCPSKGRLQHVLHVNAYCMDAVFRNSIVNDIARGMAYLHKHGIIHGQLCSKTCYVDTRWNVTVGDWEQFHLHTSRNERFVAFESAFARIADLTGPDRFFAVNNYHRLLFWSAPEVIELSILHRDVFVVSSPAKASDVYSYGVIFYETYTDLVPYDDLEEGNQPTSPYEIVKRIRAGELLPLVPTQAVNSYPATELIPSFWEKDTHSRPSFHEIVRRLRHVNPRQKSIADSMMQAVEQYASSLEEKIEERTLDLDRVTDRLDQLLKNMMPAPIADKISRGELVESESYESCSLFLSEIDGFAGISAASPAEDVVSLLNDVYSVYDGIIERFDVCKVEAVGDSYMVVSGIPERNGAKHADQIASMSLAILRSVSSLTLTYMPEQKVRIRIGVHSGPLAAGVVGLKVPRYVLFGDTVVIAQKIKSSAMPMRIQISATTKELLEKFHGYNASLRGSIEIEGKGTIETFWLTGRANHQNPLPRFEFTRHESLSSITPNGTVKWEM